VFQAEINRVANDASLLDNGWVNQDPGSVPVLEASLNQPDGSFNHLDLTKEVVPLSIRDEAIEIAYQSYFSSS
jgi:hypothetical protein